MITPTRLLAFESRGWLHAGPKERGIRDELGMSPVHYYQLLTGAMHDDAAVAAHPATAARLRRIAARKADLKYRLRYA